MASIRKTKGLLPGRTISWRYAPSHDGFDAIGVQQQVRLWNKPSTGSGSSGLLRDVQHCYPQLHVHPHLRTYTRFQFLLQEFGYHAYRRSGCTLGRLYRRSTRNLDEKKYDKVLNHYWESWRPILKEWQWKLEEVPVDTPSFREIGPLTDESAYEALNAEGIFEDPTKCMGPERWYIEWSTAEKSGRNPALLANLERLRQTWYFYEPSNDATVFELVLDTWRSTGYEWQNGFRHEFAYIRLWHSLNPAEKTAQKHVDTAVCKLEKLLKCNKTLFEPELHDEDELTIYLAWKAEYQKQQYWDEYRRYGKSGHWNNPRWEPRKNRRRRLYGY